MTPSSTLADLDLARVQDLTTLVARAAERWGDKVALLFESPETRLTFHDVERRSNAIAHSLMALGIEPGDRVGVMLRNRPEFALTWLALGKIGAVMVPLNVFYREHDARFILEHSEAKAVVTASEFLPLLRRVQEGLPALRHLFSTDGSAGKGVLDLQECTRDASEAPPAITVYPEQLVNIQYTSGTTGQPKGCMISHGYWLRIARNFSEHPFQLSDRDRILTAQPFYYMDPQWILTLSLAVGATLVVLDRFHPSTFWERIRHYEITFFYCLGAMPTLLYKMPETPEDRNHRVRYVTCSAIPPLLHRKLEERWGVPWYEVFGMTETGGDIAVIPAEHDELVGTGSIGRPLDHRDARVVDDEDRPLPRQALGELVLRGPGMMEGYFKNEEATNTAFRNGWFHTGDLVRMDEAGRLYYLGRKKDIIRRSGENISASEVEEVIQQHPAVGLAACVPVPDDVRGEEVKAYVVLKRDHTPHSAPPEDLIAHCSALLAYFKVPRYWEYAADLPRTPSERIAKGELRNAKADLRVGAYDRAEGVWH